MNKEELTKLKQEKEKQRDQLRLVLHQTIGQIKLLDDMIGEIEKKNPPKPPEK